MMQHNQPILIDNGPLLESTGLMHRVLEPNAPGPHPTVVMLHGRSGNEEVMWVFRKTIPANWLLVAPRAIERDPQGGFSWYVDQAVEWPSLSSFDTAVATLKHFIQTLPQIYNADPDHIYLMGFSQGAATAFALAMHQARLGQAGLGQARLVQGIAGLVGFVPEVHENTINLSQLPVFMAVGKYDKLVPYDRAQQSAQTLRQAQAALTYHEYDTGHKLNSQGMKDLRQWWASR